MPDQPPGDMQYRIELHERIAKLEQGLELAFDTRHERVMSLEQLVKTALHDEGGILQRLKHLDSCIDSIKKTIWMATGALAIISVAANLLTRH